MARFRPKKRDQGLRVEEFQGELLVYDLERHNAHCLNGIAAAVWQQADGTASVDEIAARLAEAEGGRPDVNLVWRALSELDAAFLLATRLDDAPLDDDRRQMMKKLAWATAIPLVLSIAVPEPAYAASATL